MARGKKHTPEQIVGLLRQIEVAVANGKTTPVGMSGSWDHRADVQPMAQGLRWFAEMLDDNPPDIAGARETAVRSIRDGNRAVDVVARLRSLFKRKDFVVEITDLNEATQKVITLSSGELRRNRVILQMHFAEDLNALWLRDTPRNTVFWP